MIDAGALITGGGSASLILAVVYAWQQWQKSRADRRAEPRHAVSAAVTDAATANSLLLASLKEEREEVARLSGRVGDLETQNALLYERIRDQRREYEAEIAKLRKQVEGFTRQLSDLQLRIQSDEP